MILEHLQANVEKPWPGSNKLHFNIIHSTRRFEQLILSWIICGVTLRCHSVGNTDTADNRNITNFIVVVTWSKIPRTMVQDPELGEGLPSNFCEKTICTKIRRLLPHQGRPQQQTKKLNKILTEERVSLATSPTQFFFWPRLTLRFCEDLLTPILN